MRRSPVPDRASVQESLDGQPDTITFLEGALGLSLRELVRLAAKCPAPPRWPAGARDNPVVYRALRSSPLGA